MTRCSGWQNAGLSDGTPIVDGVLAVAGLASVAEVASHALNAVGSARLTNIVGIFVCPGRTSIGAGARVSAGVANMAGQALIGGGSRAGFATGMAQRARLPGTVVSRFADAGELDVRVGAVGIALSADPLNDEVTRPANAGVAVPGSIDAVPLADAVSEGKTCIAGAGRTVESRVYGTVLTDVVDDVLVGSVADAALKNGTVDRVEGAVLRGNAGSVGEDEVGNADASAQIGIVATIGDAGQTTVDGGVVGRGTPALVSADGPAHSIAEGALLSEYIDDLTGGTDAGSTVPDQSAGALSLRHTHVAAHVVPIIAFALSGTGVSGGVGLAVHLTLQQHHIHGQSCNTLAFPLSVDVAISRTIVAGIADLPQSLRADAYSVEIDEGELTIDN